MFRILEKPFGKEAMEEKVRDALEITALPISRGGSTSSKLTYQILHKLDETIVPASESSKRVAQIMNCLGLSVDEWDFSKGSTVPNRGLSKIHRALTGQPRLFLFRTDSVHPLGESTTLLIDSPMQNAPLSVAGPGALVWLVNIDSDTPVPFAEVEEVQALSPDGNKKIAPWAVRIRIRGLSTPVQSALMKNEMNSVKVGDHREFVWVDSDAPLHSNHAATRNLSPSQTTDVAPSIPMRPESPELPSIEFHFRDALSQQIRQRDRFSGTKNADTDRKHQVELAAIDFASTLMSGNGWTLEIDRQQDRGFGYDLEYSKDNETIYLEVKGVSGAGLDFNMTANELLAASTLKEWAVLVVHVGKDFIPFQHEWHWGQTLLSGSNAAIVPTQLHVSFVSGDGPHNFAE